MPSVTLADLRTATRTGLTDLGRQRLEVISFFLLVLIGCAWLVQRVWNSMRKEFPILPRLSFPRAVGVIVLWGLLFVQSQRGSAARAVSGPILDLPMVPSGHSARRPTPRSSGG